MVFCMLIRPQERLELLPYNGTIICSSSSPCASTSVTIEFRGFYYPLPFLFTAGVGFSPDHDSFVLCYNNSTFFFLKPVSVCVCVCVGLCVCVSTLVLCPRWPLFSSSLILPQLSKMRWNWFWQVIGWVHVHKIILTSFFTDTNRM